MGVWVRVWAKDAPFGTELAEVSLGDGTLAASGLAIGSDPVPYRLEYQLTTTADYVTARLAVRTRGLGWYRALVLERAASGLWSGTTEAQGTIGTVGPGTEPTAMAGSLAAPSFPFLGPPQLGATVTMPARDLAALDGVLDCDLGLSPLTNTMPVLRHRLHERGGPVDFLMAWVSVPDLAVSPAPQRYTFLRDEPDARIVRFESLDSPFVADIRFDSHGPVLDYPGIARRVA